MSKNPLSNIPGDVEPDIDDLSLLDTLSTVDALKIVQLKIIYVLHVYPKLSPSMLNVGIGPSISPAIWRPALEHLIEVGLVSRSTTNRVGVSGRANTLRVLELTESGNKHAEEAFNHNRNAEVKPPMSNVPSGQGRE